MLRKGLLATCLLTMAATLAAPVYASEIATQGYIGYSGVHSNAEVDCHTRACPGVLESTLFYGLSMGFQEGPVGGQVIISQDADADPQVSLAQLSFAHVWAHTTASARAGRIIVPLGLYGSHRITPNTRPGLILPQSYLLNSFYDLLSLSDQGIALSLLQDNGFELKAAYYQPSDETRKTLTQAQPGLVGNLGGGLGGLLGNLLGGLLGGLLGQPVVPGTPPVTGTPGTVDTRSHTDKGYYVGADYTGLSWRADGGWTRLSLPQGNLDAYNAGLALHLGNWQPSVEAFRLESGNNATDGLSLTLVYNGNSWQMFGNAVRLQTDDLKATEYVLGGVYYWRSFSLRLTHHEIRGDAVLRNLSGKNLHATTLSGAYSFNF